MATNLKNFLRINEAARFLGVSAGTLRNWGRQGKLRTHRNPLNGYRLYCQADLETVLAAVHRSAAPARKENAVRERVEPERATDLARRLR